MLRDRAIIAEMKGEVTSSKVCRGVAGSDWVTQTLIQDGGRGEVCGVERPRSSIDAKEET